MKFKTTKQNRPKSVNGLMKVIEEKLAEKQIVVRKIFHTNKGWAFVYAYAGNSTLPPIKRIFKDNAVFKYYEDIEDCFKGEYDRVVLGIDDGNGTFNDAVIEKMDGLEIGESVTAIIYSSNGVKRYRKMGRGLAEHWGLDFITGEAGKKALEENANQG